MGEIGDIWRDHKAFVKEQKRRFGIDCPGCIEHHPKRNPTRLLPNQRCKVCGYVAPDNPEFEGIWKDKEGAA